MAERELWTRVLDELQAELAHDVRLSAMVHAARRIFEAHGAARGCSELSDFATRTLGMDDVASAAPHFRAVLRIEPFASHLAEASP